MTTFYSATFTCKGYVCYILTKTVCRVKNLIAAAGVNTPSNTETMSPALSAILSMFASSAKMEEVFWLILDVEGDGLPSWDKPRYTTEAMIAFNKSDLDKNWLMTSLTSNNLIVIVVFRPLVS